MAAAQVDLFPKNNAVDVPPDTRLTLVFPGAAPLNNQGTIKIFDASNDQLVDELDMSIPPGPRNTRTPPPYDTFKYNSVPDTVFTVKNPDTDTSHVYQTNDVAGTSTSSARHFFPVLLDGNAAKISPHNQRLAYGKTYYVEIDAEVFPTADKSFSGISGKSTWTFTTKATPPPADSSLLTVAADGTADFCTVQGAIDSIPNNNVSPKEIYIKNGSYDEIVILSNKQNLTFHGESRDKVIVRYATNGVFNSAGRSEFTISGATAVNLINFTIQSVGSDSNPAQAEALYVKGDKIQVYDVTMLGSGDALQIQSGARIYLSGSSVRGYGDNILSYGAAFFKGCHLISTYGPHGWPRNPSTNHGDVFLNCTFSLDGVAAPPAMTGALGTSGDGHCDLARSPSSGTDFPNAEFVILNSKLDGISSAGWGAAAPDNTNVHFWEYQSVNLSDGQPVDVSKRVSYSKQLTLDKDADTIANYGNPSYVLAGWTPELAPIVVQQPPASLSIAIGGSAELVADAVAQPDPTYQWFKDGQALSGETGPKLELQAATNGTAGEYTVSITNRIGTVMSTKTTVVVGAQASQPASGGAAAQAGAGGVDAGMQLGTGGTSATPGAAAQAGATSGAAAPPAAGAVVHPGGEAGSIAGAANAAGSGLASQQPRAHGGCSVRAAPNSAVDAWVCLIAWLGLLARRRRFGES